MAKLKSIFEWFCKNFDKILTINTFIIIIVDIIIIVKHFFYEDVIDGTDIAIMILAGVTTVLYMFYGIRSLEKMKFDRFLASATKELQKFYLHGFNIKHYVDTVAFLRLEKWLDCGLCYELSVLAMILAKNNKTTRLCRGDYYNEDGKFQTKHSWVEIKIPFNGWFVIDLAWSSPGLLSRRRYFRHYSKGKSKLVRKWICTHEDFWKMRFPNLLRDSMQSKETSNVLLEFSAFCPPGDSYGFSDWIYGIEKICFSDDSNAMIPRYIRPSNKPISTRIVRDFVKNPKRKEPKAKSIRLAKMIIRKYDLQKAQQS